MKQLSALICLLILFSESLAQEKKFETLEARSEWNDGSLMLNDGTELKGLLRYEDTQGILSYKNGETSRSFTPRSVSAFEFFDGSLNKQRVYYTLEHEDSKTNVKRPLFFEVVKDFKTFVVLSKRDPVDIETKETRTYFSSSPTSPNSLPVSESYGLGPKTEIRQVETIYFMDEHGVLEPYLKVTRTTVDRLLYDREKAKNKIVDRDILEKYFTPQETEAMEKYAEENDLRFRDKGDLIKILEFCADLREKKGK